MGMEPVHARQRARRRLLGLGLAVLLAVPVALVFAGRAAPELALLSVAGVLLMLFWALRTHLEPILLTFVAVLLATTMAGAPRLQVAASESSPNDVGALLDKWRAVGGFRKDLPVVVHLVFDELLSTGAMSDGLPGGAETRRAFYMLGERHGFRTFDSVYSRQFFSGAVLPNLFEREFEHGDTALDVVSTTVRGNVPDNSYFDEMGRQGYRTAVFQTSILDFCASARVALCEEFDSFDPAVLGAGRDEKTRSVELWNTLLRSYEPSYASRYGRALLRRLYGIRGDDVAVLGVQGRYDVQGFPAWFDRFAAFVAGAPRGSHVFAHFMVPHSPYLLASSCVVSGSFEAGYYLGKSYPVAADRERARSRYYRSYLDQVRCVEQKLDLLFGELADDRRFDDAVIIVHGDHGSRISAGNLLEQQAPRDFVDNYATYFAVKTPWVEPGVDCRFLSLPQVFRRALSAGGLEEAAEPPLPVLVATERGGGGERTVAQAMPRFGCALRGSPEQ